MARISLAERQWSQMCGKAFSDAAEERLEPVDFEVGVDAALHEDPGAAHLFGFGDLGVDRVEVEDVAFGGERGL